MNYISKSFFAINQETKIPWPKFQATICHRSNVTSTPLLKFLLNISFPNTVSSGRGRSNTAQQIKYVAREVISYLF